MDYKVRHKEMGIFQGEFLGMGFWYPMSDQPKQGLCRFPTEVEAKSFIQYYCNEDIGDFKAEYFTIEPFDETSDFEMQLVEIEET